MSKLQKYPSYKESGVEWIGEIPEHWEVQKLKFNSKIETGNSISDSKKNSYENIEVESYPYIATKDINYEYSIIDYDNGLRIPTIEKKFKITNPNTTLICIEGGSAGKKIAFNTQKVCYVNKLASIQNQTNVSPKFLYYLAKSHMFKNQFELSMNGLIGGVSTLIMKNFELVFPPKPEQTAIASFLDEKTAKIDQVISQKQKLIELLKERRQIVINDAVTKGLDKNVEFVDSGVEWIGEIPKGWEVVRSKRLFQQRKDRARKGDKQLTASQKYGVIYQDKYMELESRRVTQVEYNHEILKRAVSGDFLISMRSFQGGIEYCRDTGSVSSAYVALIPMKRVVPEYFKYLFKSQKYITALSSTSNLVRDGQALRFENFSLVNLLVIPEDEQAQIADYIDNQTKKIDTAIELQQNYISKLKEYKASLIDSVVTGKVRVV